MESLINKNIFIRFFEKDVRIKFNWERLKEEAWPIHITLVDDIDIIKGWFMAWNFNQDGKMVDYYIEGAMPIQAGSIKEYFNSLDLKKKEFINENMNKIHRDNVDGFIQRLVLPLYKINDQSMFIMDGNHRIAASILSGVRLIVMCFVVCGPIDRTIIPELKHWEK